MVQVQGEEGAHSSAIESATQRSEGKALRPPLRRRHSSRSMHREPCSARLPGLWRPRLALALGLGLEEEEQQLQEALQVELLAEQLLRQRLRLQLVLPTPGVAAIAMMTMTMTAIWRT